MSGYSDNREQNIEIKYLRRVLSGQDIKLPESLRGSELLHKLPEPVKKPERLPLFRGGKRSPVFAWQSGVSYAVAFALIIAVFYGLRMSSPQMIDGHIAVSSQNSVADNSKPAEESANADIRVQAFTAIPAQGELEDDKPEPAVQRVERHSADIDTQLPAADEADIKTTDDNSEVGGVGGGGISYMVGEYENYILTCRENDQSDPDKAGFPVTLEIVDNSEGGIVAQTDIPDMIDIKNFFVDEDILALIGTNPDGGVMTRVYSGFSSMALSGTASANQPGELANARLYEGVLYAVTICGNDEALGVQPELLENSLEEGVCFITALDIQSGEFTQTAFADASSDISLLDRHMYIYYNGKDQESGNEERFVAQINIDGLNIAINKIT